MRYRILKGAHGLVTPKGVKFTVKPGDEVDLTAEQFARIGAHRSVALSAAPPSPAAAARPPKETAPPPAAALAAPAADGQGRWADILHLKTNRVKEVIERLESIEEIESLASAEEAARNRAGVKMAARERIEELKQKLEG